MSLFFASALVFVALSFDTTLCQLIPYGSQQTYDFENHVQSGDLNHGAKNIASYRITGRLHVRSAWNADERQILGFELAELRLSSMKNDRVQDVGSSLDSLAKRPFYLLLNDQEPREFYSDEEKDISLQNLQKGLASLFQFNFKATTANEEDVSGSCSVLYQKQSSTSHRKIKTSCANWALKLHRRTEVPLDVYVKSRQEIDYKFSQDGILLGVSSNERHSFDVAMNKLLGNAIESVISLQHTRSEEIAEVVTPPVDPEFLSSNFVGSSLEAEVDGNVRRGSKETTLTDSIQRHHDELSDDKLGTQELSRIFIELVPLVRQSSTDELIALLKSASNATIRNQLIDLLGAAQTKESHAAITAVFFFNRDDDFPPLEKYLQALTIGTRPTESIMDDLLRKVNSKKFQNEKLKETTRLTLSAMAFNHARFSAIGTKHPLYEKILSGILADLEKCETDECKAALIRCLQNLKDQATVPNLLKIALNDARKPAVAAMKALKTFPAERFTSSHRKQFEVIFYEVRKRYDSSARTLALDILLDMKPSRDQLTDLLRYLSGPDRAFEVKTYLLQKINMIAEQCPKFAALVRSVLATTDELRNYNILAQKGLTTALQRQFSSAPSYNGSLLSLQEVYKGVLKRGLVDMMITTEQDSVSVFTLGIYTNGLSSFMGGSNDEDVGEQPVEEDETASAGMELAVLGVQLRPLVFFSGQGELMGHVWSGTASDATPAYQATVLMHDHEEYIVLQNGATVYLRVLSANSIDLNGQVEVSLWNRNAHAEINKNSGLAIYGSTVIATSFVTLENTFTSQTEPKIALIADIDFYSDIKLCIQLNRVESKVRISLQKSRALNSNKPEKNVRNVSYRLPGFTMALNQKNNEMCNMIFS